MNDLSDLYQQAVLDHNRKPRNFRRLPDPDGTAEGYNPLCGDLINVDVKMDGDVIREIGFEGGGCAISKASASMMTEVVKGMTRDEAREFFDSFRTAVTEGIDFFEAIDKLGKLAALTGVSEFPARVKCAVLAWHTLRAALDGNKANVTTE
ncbi:MAG: SUF system NifU family Fe-S cluster assembly protein [Chloroflexi bacterium]|nr:SUF system NifU family Fe-S cluster assembly protein [Chloroflexota bacterium]